MWLQLLHCYVLTAGAVIVQLQRQKIIVQIVLVQYVQRRIWKRSVEYQGDFIWNHDVPNDVQLFANMFQQLHCKLISSCEIDSSCEDHSRQCHVSD